MKRALFLSILIFFFTIIFMSLVGCSDNRKVNYQLQKQCGEDSQKFYKEKFQFPTPEYYKNHYNKKMNKCLILVKGSVMGLKSLWDVNENKQYGVYYQDRNGNAVACSVLEKECKSEQEWDLLVKPYMED